MRLTAASQQAAFQYDDAIKTYLDLYDTTKKAKKLGIKPPEPLPGEKPLTLEQIGLDALYNAAFARRAQPRLQEGGRSLRPVPEDRARPPQAGPRASGRSRASIASRATSTT